MSGDDILVGTNANLSVEEAVRDGGEWRSESWAERHTDDTEKHERPRETARGDTHRRGKR